MALCPRTPIFLLKTRSTPHDGYDEFFSTHGYHPAFIPVLEHKFNETNLERVRELFTSGSLIEGPNRKYGGLIFTSQRAVEGFARLLNTIDESITRPASLNFPLYTVGPATSRSLHTLRDTHLPHAEIYGSDAGNGETLAKMILEHYIKMHLESPGTKEKPPLLFLVGEQRRDIIPRTLMSETLPPSQRIVVDELPIYETGVMQSFETDFASAVTEAKRDLDRSGDVSRAAWVVVFSPTGCDAMLRVLGLDGGREREGGEPFQSVSSGRRIFVATIGPTTRDHLRDRYAFEVDVCAEKPSPEGLGKGIEEFMHRYRHTNTS
ncbi:hypothetical protein ASPZODRAFT_129566 [Penicilliopsis zonata CBS 506.65]|uniref:Tetrapyrrole biosynthesis uroporphyrinogen III synthase domain-containing protein n=1 Tax=Penicilliopsis zonata CBS 506.65 TaxID=1073090 RepID=A0A1L9SPM6_9EURO|nr:hypothetical protein ASPZODRAFT_129566 [Penicilliopsis zonata CBS 506.65]OJJ49160.1 hypothetical protein ASPZODRAFT_129566 [Penicilliopsis zonata CBS 506.65]